MTKILILLKTFDGGTGTFVNDLLKIKETERNFNIKITVLEKSSLRKINNNEIVYFASKNFYPEKYQFSLKVLLTLIREFFWLKGILNEYQPDIILSIDSHCLILAQATRLIFPKKIKLAATIHNNIEAVINHKTPKRLINTIKAIIGFSLRRADKVIVVSKGLSNHLYQFFNLKDRPEVIYYDLSPVYLANKIQKPKTFSQQPIKTILTMSRLFPQKDIRTLIKAYGLVKAKISGIKLWIVGDGPLKPKLKETVKHMMLKDIKFFGWVDDPLKLMNQADLFVFSSHWEGFGYTIIEAMSQGLPIVATNTPFGPKEILKNGTSGKLVSMADAEEMAKVIYQLLTNPKQYHYFSQKSIERSQDFTLNNMVKEYKKIFDELVSPKN